MANTIHEGRNVKRFREMRGIKQETLAWELGEDWSQKKVSLLESKERIELPLLQRLAGALKVPLEALKQFEEEQAIDLLSNTFHSREHSLEEIRKLHEEKMSLYERMLQEKEEMMSRLEKLISTDKRSA